MSEPTDEDDRQLRGELMMVQIEKGRVDIERVRQQVDQGRLDIDRIRQEMEKGRLDIDRVRQELRYEGRKFAISAVLALAAAIGAGVGIGNLIWAHQTPPHG